MIHSGLVCGHVSYHFTAARYSSNGLGLPGLIRFVGKMLAFSGSLDLFLFQQIQRHQKANATSQGRDSLEYDALTPSRPRLEFETLSVVDMFLQLTSHTEGLLEIGEMVISAFIGLIGLGPAGRVCTFHLLMTSYSTRT